MLRLEVNGKNQLSDVTSWWYPSSCNQVRTNARASARACPCSFVLVFIVADDDEDEDGDEDGTEDTEGRRASIKASSEHGIRVS